MQELVVTVETSSEIHVPARSVRCSFNITVSRKFTIQHQMAFFLRNGAKYKKDRIIQMVTATDVYSLKAKLNYLKQQLYHDNISQEQKDVVNRYLNQVIDVVERSLRP